MNLIAPVIALAFTFSMAVAAQEIQMPHNGTSDVTLTPGEGLPDASGRKVTSKARAVVSLSPAVTELLYAMKLDQKIVGVSDYSDYPEAAKKKPHVGAYTSPSLEAIVALKPDLVIIPDEGPEDIKAQMDRLPLPYAVVRMRTIDEIGETAAQLGSWLGDAEEGKTFRSRWKDKVNRTFAHRSQTGLKVLVEIQSEPLIAAGNDTFLNEIVNRCGGENVIKENGYPHVAVESLVKKHVDLILLTDAFSNNKDRTRAKTRWKHFSPTEDVKVAAVDPDLAARPGPRLTEGMQKICTLISGQK